MSEGLRAALRRWPLASRARLLRLNLISRTGAHQDFAEFIDQAEWRAALSAADGKRVLIATNTGGHFALAAIDRMLAVALTLRGAAVTSVLCDAALPACQMCEFTLTLSMRDLATKRPDPLLCGYCHEPAAQRLNALGLPLAKLGAHLTDADRAEAKALAASATPENAATLVWRGMPIGEHALAGALRFFACGDLQNEPDGAAILKRYVESAALTAAAYARLIEATKPDVLVAHHGIYTPQGLAAAAARAAGVRVVTWNPAYRRHCFIFSHDDTYHHTLMNEPVEVWRDRPLSAEQAQRVMSYLESRRRGDADWIRFHQDPDANVAALGLDPAKPLIVALTNVFWDAQLHYPANAFADQRTWLLDTIAFFAERPDLQLVIRVHPAEVSGSPPSRQRAMDAIASRYPTLPGNVKIVPPESALSTYALAEAADAALIYGTKMGVELSAVGMPVIVAGEAWARGKGFTIDAISPDDYRAQLARLPFGKRLDPAQQILALQYAHHFFFRRMIELGFVEPVSGARRFNIAVKSLDGLRPGASHGLDVICTGILDGAPFVA